MRPITKPMNRQLGLRYILNRHLTLDSESQAMLTRRWRLSSRVRLTRMVLFLILPSEDVERWLSVACEGSREGYRDMEAFIESLADPNRADRLWIAFQGRGAFRRFKDVLGCTPDELDRWFTFSEERQRGSARAWLAGAGFNPSPRPPSGPVAQPI